MALVAVGLVILVPLGAQSAARASGGVETTVTLASQPGSYVGSGQDLFFNTANSTISASVSSDGSTVEVSAYMGSVHLYNFLFGAPQGEALKNGDYLNGHRMPSRDAPRFDVGGDGRGCNEELGNFHVSQITRDSSGKLASLLLTFAGRCSADPHDPGFLGEIRYAVPGDGGGAVVAPRQILWPDTGTNYGGFTAPVVIWNSGQGSVQLGASSISGTDASDETITSDGCAGTTLAAGENCKVNIRNKPVSPGENTATLSVPEVGGITHTVSLGGYAVNASGVATFASQAGAALGGGENVFFNPRDSEVAANLSYKGSVLTISGTGGGHAFSFTFGAPVGQKLGVGDYRGARSTLSADAPEIAISADGKGCEAGGRFRVATMDQDVRGYLTDLSISFAGRCGSGNDNGFLGEVRYGVPGDSAGGIVVAPGQVIWPDTESDYPPFSTPATVWNPGPAAVQVGASTISGQDAADNTITADGCSGLTLATGQSCNVMVRYAPSKTGDEHATLSVPVGSGVSSVSLEGAAVRGDTVVSLASEPGDTIGDGKTRLFRVSDSTFATEISYDGSYVDVSATKGGYATTTANLRFGAPEGRQLTAGFYQHARSTPRSTAWPVLNVWGGALYQCEDVEGRFRVRRITTDSAGNLTSLWVTFAARCGSEIPAIVGEVRFHVPPEDGAAVIGPRAVLWPQQETDDPAVTTPLEVWNPGSEAVQFGVSSISGPDAANNSIVSDGCSGRPLAPGNTCEVVVLHEPLAVGASEATLSIPESNGAVHSISLEGRVERNATFVTLASDPGDFIGQGGERFFTRRTSDIRADLSDDGSYAIVYIDHGVHAYMLTFAAPKGQQLKVGDYLHVQRFPLQDDGRPGIDVIGDGRGCSGNRGRFRVRQLTKDAADELTSFWVDFEQQCEGAPPSLLGEVRYGVPAQDGVVSVGPQNVWWPDSETDSAPRTTPVIVWNPGAAPVGMGASSIAGPSAADDSIQSDGCAGVSLAPDDHCEVVVKYKPGAAGDSEATLTVPEADGTAHSVSLEGFVSSGKTRFSIGSDAGDPMGQGLSYQYVPTNATFIAGGDYRAVDLGWVGTDGNSWQAKFELPEGETLTPGVTYSATGPNGDGSTPLMYVSVNGRKCDPVEVAGDFTVTDIYVDKWGEVQRFGAKFDQHCSQTTPALHGRLQFQVNDLVPTLAGKRLNLAGQISPNAPGKTVLVRLLKKHKRKFKTVAKRRLTLSSASTYQAHFKRPKAKVCRAVALFPSRDKHLASRTRKTFHC
jgi:hypothetical protein